MDPTTYFPEQKEVHSALATRDTPTQKATFMYGAEDRLHDAAAMAPGKHEGPLDDILQFGSVGFTKGDIHDFEIVGVEGMGMSDHAPIHATTRTGTKYAAIYILAQCRHLFRERFLSAEIMMIFFPVDQSFFLYN